MAHNLKDVLEFSTLVPLSELALKLETCGKQEDLTGAPVLVEQIEMKSHVCRISCSTTEVDWVRSHITITIPNTMTVVPKLHRSFEVLPVV